VVKQTRLRCFLALLLIAAVRPQAQEYNAVPLDHAAYDVITMGVMRGIILPPPGVKPWSVHAVTQKLREILSVSTQMLSEQEEETALRALDSLERKAGFEPQDGRYRSEGDGFTFETGLGWESGFSVETADTSFTSVNMLQWYLGGDIANFASWNVTALGEFLYIERNQQRYSPRSAYAISSAFPFASGKPWDGGVLSLRNPGDYAGWPDDPALACGLEAEFNGIFFDDLLKLRLGRIRRDWGPGVNGASLFMNAHARPFAALEGTFMPLSWLNISFLGGALEHFGEDSQWPSGGLAGGPFSNVLTAAQIEINPIRYIRLDIGAAAVVLEQPNAAFFSNLELRIPGLLALWGGIFVDRLNSSSDSFFALNGNSYAYQAGVKTLMHWLPFAAFTLRYTKIQPYCYTGKSGFISGGESLGFYLPPNSDELLLRIESMLFPAIKAHVQFQMIRHGADYGYGAVPGSSLYDTLADGNSGKYFLMDGVYQWDNVIKLGGSCNLKASGTRGSAPLAIFAETGLIVTNYTINGDAGVGNEADYETLNDSVYRGRTGFLFSIGFRVFP